MHRPRPLFSTQRIADAFEQHRLVVLLVILGMSLVAGYGHLHVPTADRAEEDAAKASPQLASPSSDNSSRDAAMAASAPVAARRFEHATTECLLVIEVDDIFTSETAAAVRSVIAEVESLPQVARCFWLDKVPNLNMFGLADPLIPSNNASPELFRLAKDRALQHPLASGQLISEDGRTLLVSLWLDWIYITSDEIATSEILETARAAALRSEVQPMRIRLTGRVPLYVSAQKALSHNHLKFQVIGYSLVLLLAVLLFRGLSAVIIVAGAPALGIFWSLGILKLFDQLDNPLTGAVLPVLVSMVGFTDGVHLIVHIRAARAAGQSPLESAKSAIRKVGLACLLTSLTTAIGFGSLMLASNEYVRGFGSACAIGVLLTFLAVICFIPLMSTTRLARNIHRGHEKDLVRAQLDRLSPFIQWVVLHRLAISAVSFLVTGILLAWSAVHLQPDDRLSDSQPSGSEAYQALVHCDSELGGIETIEVRVYWTRERSQDLDEVLQAIRAARAVVDDEPLVNNALSIHDFLDQLPGTQNRVLRSVFLPLLPETIQEHYFNSNARMAAITGRIQDRGIASYEPVFSRIEDRLQRLKRDRPGFNFQLLGTPVHRGRELYRIVVDLTTSLGTASIIILLTMAIVYRSWTVGFITIVPNMFPLVVTAAFLVVVGQPLEIASVCSFTVCLGIAVDDSIHFLSRYHDERSAGKTAVEAVQSTFVGVGTALITTTLVLIAGFGTVLSSDLPGHRTFASMACWTIGAALVGDLVFLPALLVCFDRWRDSSDTVANAASDS